MSKNIKKELSCAKCPSQFGSNLAKFSSNFAYNLHLSVVHKQNNENEPRSEPVENCETRNMSKQQGI